MYNQHFDNPPPARLSQSSPSPGRGRAALDRGSGGAARAAVWAPRSSCSGSGCPPSLAPRPCLRPRRRNSRPRNSTLPATRRATASRRRTERNERPMDPAAAQRRGSTNETVNPGCRAPRAASAARTLAARSVMAMLIPGARPSTTTAIIQAGAIQCINQTCTRLTC